MENEENINEELIILMSERKLKKEEIKNKQETKETILNQNNELLKFSHYFDQNRMVWKDGSHKFSEQRKRK